MGADLYFETLEGERVGYFRDSYNATSLFGVLNGTLKTKQWSWWMLTENRELFPVQDDYTMEAEYALRFHDMLVEALVGLTTTEDDWIQSYDEHILMPGERQEYLARLVELLILLRKTYQNNWRVEWSV